MKIVVLDGYTVNPNKDGWDELKEAGEVVAYDRTKPEEIIPRIKDADYIFTDKCIIDRHVIDSCPHLKWIGVLATGYNIVDTVYAKEKGIPVANVPAYSTMAVAQHTFALLLQICHHIREHADSVTAGKWQHCPDFCYWDYPLKDLAGKTMGIFGFGNIGRRVARIAEAFGMKVLISSNYPDPDFTNESIRFVKDQDEIFAGADVISLHCPLTEKNEGLINAQNIAKMKDGVILLNTARGKLVREQELADALKSGKVGAAGIDVLAEEPPVNGSPLIGLENCVLTPHIAWSSEAARRELYEVACSNLIKFHKTGELTNVVNP